MRRRVAALVGVVAAALVVSCGVPAQDRPHVIPDAALPPEQATPSSTIAASVDASIYFVRDDQPVRVARRVGSRALDGVLDALLAGPTDAELAAGIRTALPADAELRVVEVAGRVATVDVGSLLDGITGQEQILVFAQLVLTATDPREVDGVVFERAGRGIDAPTVDGTLVTRPLTRGDYASLLQPA